jgi:hypothetical protein
MLHAVTRRGTTVPRVRYDLPNCVVPLVTRVRYDEMRYGGTTGCGTAVKKNVVRPNTNRCYVPQCDPLSGPAAGDPRCCAYPREDLGGADAVSMAEASLVRRASVLEVECELLESRFATAGQATAEDLDLYQRVAGNLRRLFDDVGLKRREPPVPTLAEFLEASGST